MYHVCHMHHSNSLIFWQFWQTCTFKKHIKYFNEHLLISGTLESFKLECQNQTNHPNLTNSINRTSGHQTLKYFAIPFLPLKSLTKDTASFNRHTEWWNPQVWNINPFQNHFKILGFSWYYDQKTNNYVHMKNYINALLLHYIDNIYNSSTTRADRIWPVSTVKPIHS